MKEANVYIVYHSADLDGWASGYILTLWHQRQKESGSSLINYKEIIPIPFHYHQELPEIKDSFVYMADVSLPMNKMLELAQNNIQVHWYDHHISAYNDYLNTRFPENFYYYYDPAIAACEIVWNELYVKSCLVSINTPTWVLLLSQYDTWKNQDYHAWNTYILPFQYGMRSLVYKMEDFFKVIPSLNTNQVISIGEAIIRYEQEKLKRESTAFYEVKLDNLNCVVLNTTTFNSMAFSNIYDSNKHDLMIAYRFNREGLRISLYSTHESVDCSQIAKSLGGGGHKGAAGVTIKEWETNQFVLAILNSKKSLSLE